MKYEMSGACIQFQLQVYSINFQPSGLTIKIAQHSQILNWNMHAQGHKLGSPKKLKRNLDHLR